MGELMEATSALDGLRLNLGLERHHRRTLKIDPLVVAACVVQRLLVAIDVEVILESDGIFQAQGRDRPRRKRPDRPARRDGAGQIKPR